MPWQSYKRYLPTREWIREHLLFRHVSHFLLAPDLWHLNRRSVGGAVFIGLFTAFIPLPIQSLIAAAFAMVGRCNLPISVALVWITNPLTMGPMFFFAYKLGVWLLGADVEVTNIELSWSWLTAQFSQIWWPFILGCVVCGWVAGLSGMVVARMIWRFHIIKRWRRRRERRRARAI